MLRRPDRRLAWLVAALLSTAAHAGGLLVLRAAPPRPVAVPFRVSDGARVPWPADAGADATHAGRVRRRPAPLEAGGPRTRQNVDHWNRGEGGDASGAERVTLLVSHADAVQLQDGPNDAVRTSQISRLRTALDRAAWENLRRATPRPLDDPHVATGDGPHAERRPRARFDAAEGARRAPAPSERGATARRGPGPLAVTPVAGAMSASPGRGIAEGRGRARREAARVATGRPAVDRANASTLAELRDRVRDDTDAERLAAQLVQSWVDASPRAGARPGPGRGGVGGGGDPGAGGGALAGGRASARGGPGDFASIDRNDRRYRGWYLRQRRAVEDALVYPRARQLALDQGAVVYELLVRRDGSLARPPRRKRSSGFADMDQAASEAIAAALPFTPLPADLAPGRRPSAST